MNLGVFWPKDGYVYRDGTLGVERLVCRTGVPLAHEAHPNSVEARVAAFLAAHPASEVIVRCDYHETHAVASATELADWRTRVAWAINRNTYKQNPQRVLFQLWNEPQLEGAPTWTWCADEYSTFASTVATYVPGARALPTPIAPYHPDALGAPAAPPGIEPSPWARLYYHSLVRMLGRSPAPTTLNVHVYGDPQDDRLEPWSDATRTPEGWRFAFNVARTWRDCHTVAGTTLPSYVTEFNTAARGTPPALNYPDEWLFHAVGALGATLADVRGAAWFCGQSRHPSWDWYALHGIPVLLADWTQLQAQGW